MKKVMVFGTFDGLHAGHRAFLREARKFGDHLTVVVAQDRIVNLLKGHFPRKGFSCRCEHLRQEQGVDRVVGSDAEVGTWEILEKVKPEVIALGYDQTRLKKSLEAHVAQLDWTPEIRVIAFQEPGDPAL
jgi:cytidyltransferase-like protein